MVKASSPKPPARKGIVPRETRSRKPRALAGLVDTLTKPLLDRHGFVHGAIATKWPDIVGDDMARHTQPEKIVFSKDGVSGGVLHLKCASGALATEIQHLEPQILERINTFFGYRAIVRLVLKQGPLPQSRGKAGGKAQTGGATAEPPLSAADAKALAQTLADTLAQVDDEELRAALAKLGEGVLKRKGK